MAEEIKKNVREEIPEEQKKFTLNVWVKGLVHYKWWVIGGTLGLGLIGALGTQFGINKVTETLEADYLYNLATIVDEENVERYVDGSLFSYADVVSVSNLEAVKAKDEAFAKIDVQKIIKNNAISVSRTIDYKVDSNGNAIPNSKIVSYAIKAKAKFFPNKEVGKKYVEALILSPKQASSDAIGRYNVTSYVSSFESLSFAKKVTVLQDQYKEIANTYVELDDKFGGFVIGNGSNQTLSQIASDFTLSNSNIELLASSFYANSYVDYVKGSEDAKIAEIKEEAQATIQTLKNKENELKVAKELLQTMQSATIISSLNSESEYAKELIKLEKQIVSLSNEINKITKDLNWAGFFLDSDTSSPTYGEYTFDDTDTKNACYQLTVKDPTWVAKNDAYANELLSGCAQLENERQEATSVFKFLYSHYNNGASILGSGHVHVKGGVNWAIGLVVGLVLGFALASFVTGESELNRKKEEKAK